jgi:hypothetical protein
MALFGESLLVSYDRLAPLFLVGDVGSVARLAGCLVGLAG